MRKEDKISIPLRRFEELLEIETRAYLLQSITQEERYIVEREKVATILGFHLKEHKPNLSEDLPNEEIK